jgi:transcriptional regulator GlxA family with amidase domain
VDTAKVARIWAQFSRFVTETRAISDNTEVIGILLIEGYPIIPFSCVVDSMRAANRLSGKDLYQWEYYAPAREPVAASCGITVPTRPLGDARNLSTLVVVAPNTAQDFDNAVTLRQLNALDKQQVNLGSASSGSFILARAGLLDDCRCTIHWENIPVFKELYPQLEVAFSLYEIAERRFTCSGGTAALDMMLKLIENQHGRQLAQQISQQFQHDRIRTEIDSQQMADRIDLAMSAPQHRGAARVTGDRAAVQPVAAPDRTTVSQVSQRHAEPVLSVAAAGARQAVVTEHQSQRYRYLDRHRFRNPVLFYRLLSQALW